MSRWITKMAKTTTATFLIFQYVLLSMSVNSQSTQFKDITVLIGTMVQLNCTKNVSKAVLWKYLKPCEILKNLKDIPVSVNMSSKYNFSNSSTIERYTLRFYAMDLSYAGTYYCDEEDGFKDVEVANITVVEAIPKCDLTYQSTSFEPDSSGSQYLLQCTFGYSGPSDPYVAWKSNANQADFTECHSFPGPNSICSHIKLCNITILNGTHIDTNSSNTSSTDDLVLLSYSQNGSQYNCIWMNTSLSSRRSKDTTYTFYLSNSSTLFGSLECSSNASNSNAGETNTRSEINQPTTSPKTPLIPVIITVTCVVVFVIILLNMVIVIRNKTRAQSKKKVSEIRSDFSVDADSEDKKKVPIYAELEMPANAGQASVVEASGEICLYCYLKDDGENSDANAMGSRKDLIIDNSMYGVSSESKESQVKAASKLPTQNIGLDGVVYEELGPAPKNRAALAMDVPSKSLYEEIDHTARVPPPPPQLSFKRKY